VSINNQSLLEIARLNGDAIISLQSSRKALQIITHTPRWLPSEDRNQVDAPILCHYCLGVFYIYIHIHLRYSVGLTDAWQARDTHCDRSDKSWAASEGWLFNPFPFLKGKKTCLNLREYRMVGYGGLLRGLLAPLHLRPLRFAKIFAFN